MAAAAAAGGGDNESDWDSDEDTVHSHNGTGTYSFPVLTISREKMKDSKKVVKMDETITLGEHRHLQPLQEPATETLLPFSV